MMHVRSQETRLLKTPRRQRQIPTWHWRTRCGLVRSYGKTRLFMLCLMVFFCHGLCWITGIMLAMGSANERRRYDVTSSLIGWTYTHNDPWLSPYWEWSLNWTRLRYTTFDHTVWWSELSYYGNFGDAILKCSFLHENIIFCYKFHRGRFLGVNCHLVTIGQGTVYPKKYAHGFCFAVLCCGYTLTDFPISIRLTSLALWQSNDCPSAGKVTLMNMDKYFMWIHYERLHNHNKAKHNKTVYIFLGIYCNCLAPKQATIWTNNDQNLRGPVASLGHNVLCNVTHDSYQFYLLKSCTLQKYFRFQYTVKATWYSMNAWKCFSK